MQVFGSVTGSGPLAVVSSTGDGFPSSLAVVSSTGDGSPSESEEHKYARSFLITTLFGVADWILCCRMGIR